MTGVLFINGIVLFYQVLCMQMATIAKTHHITLNHQGQNYNMCCSNATMKIARNI